MGSQHGRESCPLLSALSALGWVASGQTPMRLRPSQPRPLLYLLGPHLLAVSSASQTLPTTSPPPDRKTCSRLFPEKPVRDGLPLMGIPQRSLRLSSLRSTRPQGRLFSLANDLEVGEDPRNRKIWSVQRQTCRSHEHHTG